MLGIPLELANLERLAIDVRQQPARGLAVEARRGHECVPLLDALRPRGRLELRPVEPAIPRRIRFQVYPRRALIVRRVHLPILVVTRTVLTEAQRFHRVTETRPPTHLANAGVVYFIF